MNGDRWEVPDTVKIDGCMHYACKWLAWMFIVTVLGAGIVWLVSVLP